MAERRLLEDAAEVAGLSAEQIVIFKFRARFCDGRQYTLEADIWLQRKIGRFGLAFCTAFGRLPVPSAAPSSGPLSFRCDFASIELSLVADRLPDGLLRSPMRAARLTFVADHSLTHLLPPRSAQYSSARAWERCNPGARC
jgi:hypothetical protein